MFTKLIKFHSFITYSYEIHSDQHFFMWYPVETFSIRNFENGTFFKKLEYRFLGESSKIGNATFPFKTATSEASVKINRTEIHKWTYHKEQRFANNYFQKQSPRGVLKNFAKFTGKHLHQSLRCAGLQLYLKKKILAQMFSCEFWETSKNTSGGCFCTLFFLKKLFQFKNLLHKKLF